MPVSTIISQMDNTHVSAAAVSPSHLMKSPWTSDGLRAIIARNPARPLLPALDSSEWRRAGSTELGRLLSTEIRALAEAEIEQPLPALTDELYAHFHQTGIRLTFENVYFERRKRLAHAALAILLSTDSDTARPRLVASFLTKLSAIFEEESWALPAHIRAEPCKVRGKDPRCIDLFCAETSNLFVDLLEVFGAIIPLPLQASIRERLHRDVFQNYLDQEFHWLSMTNNWNAVCHQGVIGSALALSDDADLLAAMLLRARASLPIFLSGFTPDGGCSEGPTYWQYGFGWLALLNERLEHRTASELSLFADDPFIHSLARFGPDTCLSNGHLVNFSDCSPTGGLDPAILAYLGERLDETSCRSASVVNYRRMLRHGVDWGQMRTDFLHVSRWLLRFPDSLPISVAPPNDIFYPDLALLVARGSDSSGHLWEFAAKAGHNDEQHNHNDCGSFLINLDGRRILAEIGAPEYVRDYFSDKRYQFLATRSFGHSVPLINDQEQSPGAEFAAKVLSLTLEPDRVEFSIDLTACYTAEALCRRLVRTFHFEKSAGRLMLIDEYELAAPGKFTSGLICLDTPQLSSEAGGGILLGASPTLHITPGTGTRYLGFETCRYRDKFGYDQYVERLAFAPESSATTGRLELVFSID